MQIGIDLDNYSSPVEDLENLINNYGKGREIGYLKINPERVPVIVSEGKALEEIKRYGENKVTYTVVCGKYEMITDRRAIRNIESDIALYGNAYIVRRQGEIFTALDIEEILDWLMFLTIHEHDLITKTDRGDFAVDAYLFRYNERGIWR